MGAKAADHANSSQYRSCRSWHMRTDRSVHGSERASARNHKTCHAILVLRRRDHWRRNRRIRSGRGSPTRRISDRAQSPYLPAAPSGLAALLAISKNPSRLKVEVRHLRPSSRSRCRIRTPRLATQAQALAHRSFPLLSGSMRLWIRGIPMPQVDVEPKSALESRRRGPSGASSRSLTA